ncbi:response regulator [uncultured Enterovirga sp.]|uniref:response regulator n=1 Tax=uncultured Enterovirga sp. TaxID=2026352 RepID=UPI0035CB5670
MRILILEDDPLIGMDLLDIVSECGHEVIGLCETIADMKLRMGECPDFALLDIDLPDGKSFDVASRLTERDVPFAFISASRQGDLPEHLRHARFIAKPYAHAAIRNMIGTEHRLAC